MKGPIATAGLLLTGLAVLPAAMTAQPAETANLVRGVQGTVAAVSVDSTFTGYSTEVLSDGRWIEEGREITQDHSHRDRLGNGGNTWVSADTEAEHWVRLDWPRPMTLNEVEIWWSRPEWHPRAFRVEVLRDGEWVPASSADAWLAALDRRSIIPLPEMEAQSLRVVQAPGGGGERSLMAVQEVSVFFRAEGPQMRTGARELAAAEVRRLKSHGLVRNLARLECPGAASAVVWLPGGREAEAVGLADGDCLQAVSLIANAGGFGVRWPIAHVADALAVVFSGDPPEANALVPEVYDGRNWADIRVGLRAKREPEEHRLLYEFEPVATHALRVRPAGAKPLPPVTEIEVSRYLPPRKDVWPDRLVEKGGLKDEMLASGREATFESLALWSLPMTPVRALLGMKDAPHEIGAAWDGTLLGRETLKFSFGEEHATLADCRDTVRRTLVDGWRPGVVVEGRIGPLAVRETALVAPVGRGLSPPGLFVRIEIRNLSEEPVATSIQAESTGGERAVRFQNGALVAEGDLVLLALEPSRAAEEGRLLAVDLRLGPNAVARADFVHPQSLADAGPGREAYGRTSFDDALMSFRAYWDRVLAPAAAIEVPEARINRMYKAVLAQLFINADGDIMPYGAAPSVYDKKLYGVEESFAMLALAGWGFGGDAQRYMDGTYLTPQFLKKVDVYKTYPDRHQQYRNGLQPHHAVSLYRLTRDTEWIRKHLPLLRECAEWTSAQRRRTMTLEDGRKPLHWGLLPKWSYGGDISEVQCYALYANYCCWRGLVDTAWLLAELGDAETSQRYAEEAHEYRADIDRAVEGNYQAEHDPPFLPLRLYASKPDEQIDYYQLFAGCILDLLPFERGSRHFRWIGDFLEEDNRMFCLLPRFRRDVGPGGLDALYAKGYLRAKLHEDAVEEFLLGFYAFLAFNMDHETFISRETNLLYASDLHVRSPYKVPDMSDPIPCSSAVALQWLRQMLVSEEMAGPGEFSGNLLLLSGVPRAWLGDGKTIRFQDVPTHFGPVSIEVHSEVDAGRIEARVTPPARNPYRAIKLRLRHPESRPIRSVTVDDRPWSNVDRQGEWILLPPQSGPCRVVVSY